MRVAGLLLLTVLIGAGLIHGAGAVLDAKLAVQYPWVIDYGEGIVWQQALLLPGPRAYSPDSALPFIVFHYPPLYYLLVHAMNAAVPDMLAAGRLVTCISTAVLALAAGGLVMAATAGARPLRLMCAVASVLLVLTLPNFREIGFLMRVDMTANALGALGLLVAVTGRCSVLRIGAGLMLCMAAVFTKQTELAPGMAVFVVLLWCRPRMTLMSAVGVSALGVGIVLWLQGVTDGGFLRHIVGYNLNRFDSAELGNNLSHEISNLPLLLLVPIAAIIVWREAYVIVDDRRGLARRVLLVWFGLSCCTVLGMAKVGSSFNYLNTLYVASCVMLGIALTDLLSGQPRSILKGAAFALALTIWLNAPPDEALEKFLGRQAPDQQAVLVQRISAGSKPVFSKDMVVVLRAGKTVLAEPAIIAELAATGRWDEQALLDLIRQNGIAFVISEKPSLLRERYSPAVAAALQLKFPRIERITMRHYVFGPTE